MNEQIKAGDMFIYDDDGTIIDASIKAGDIYIYDNDHGVTIIDTLLVVSEALIAYFRVCLKKDVVIFSDVIQISDVLAIRLMRGGGAWRDARSWTKV